jgi:uncharacterized protein YqgC (DUF456 family)
MHTAAYVLGFAVLAAGIIGVVAPLIPGSLLLVAGTLLVAWADGFVRVGWGTVALSAVIAALVWMVDLVAGALGARMAHASRWAALGASAGFLVGLFFGPLGMILGPALGAFALEYLKNPDADHALRAGTGAFVGFVVGGVVKVALAMVVVAIVVVRLVV